MPRYLVAKSGVLSVFICPRCKMKRLYRDMVDDPDTGLKVCKFNCSDLKDPYREAPRPPDRIDLKYPRPEIPLVPPEE